MAAVSLGNLAFGLSTHLWAALAVRFVFLGACNGYVSLMGMLCLEAGGEARELAFAYAEETGVLGLRKPDAHILKDFTLTIQ